MRVLLTAFEPFDGTGLNASLEGCRHFLERAAGWNLRFEVLPVRYGADTEAVEAVLREEPVDLLLHTGQAGGSAAFQVERLAVNVRYPEDAPSEPSGQLPILPDGPAALFATIPVESVAAAIREAGLPAVVSNHAGIYLCNHVLYCSLLRVGSDPAGPRVGFLHVPALPRQVKPEQPSATAEAIGTAIEAALACLKQDPGRSAFAPLCA